MWIYDRPRRRTCLFYVSLAGLGLGAAGLDYTTARWCLWQVLRKAVSGWIGHSRSTYSVMMAVAVRGPATKGRIDRNTTPAAASRRSARATRQFHFHCDRLTSPTRKHSMSDAWRYAAWPIQGQGQVTSPRRLEIRPFSTAISSPLYSRGWQMTTDS